MNILGGLVVALSISLMPTLTVLASPSKEQPTEIDLRQAVQNKKQSFKSQSVQVTDPNEQIQSPKASTIQTTYEAYDGLAVFDRVFGGRKVWTKFKFVKFKCSDGYQPVLPVEAFLKGGFFIAYKRKDDQPFVILNQTKAGAKEALAPYYLIWDLPSHQTLSASHFWPYQIETLSLVP